MVQYTRAIAYWAASFVTFSLFTSSETRAVMFSSRVIAVAGDSAPDNNGVFNRFPGPAINDSGQVAFIGILNGTSGGSDDDKGIFLDNGTTLTQIARSGQAVSDLNGAFDTFFVPHINEAGQVASFGNLAGTSGGNSDDGVIFRNSGGAVTQIAREGDPAPGGNGTFFELTFFGIDFNDSGQVAFSSSLTGTTGGSNDNSGVYRGAGGAVTQIARKGDTAPDNNGLLSFFSGPTLNATGQLAFRASLASTSGGSSDNSGVFRGDGSTLTQVARKGQAAPDGNGVFGGFSIFVDPIINDSGQVAFSTSFSGTTGGFADNSGIILADGNSVLQVAREGETIPGANGTFQEFENPNLNNSGQVAFIATLSGTSGGNTDNEAIFRGDDNALTEIVREGQAAPDGNGIFANFNDNFSNPALAFNDSGQVVFRALLNGTSGGGSDNNAIYLFDDNRGLVEVVREGDPLLGSTIAGVTFTSGFQSRNVNQDGLNEQGQVAYTFFLADGRRGVAIATLVPEPSSVVLLMASLLFLCRIPYRSA